MSKPHLQALGRFIGHLHSVLEDGHGELIARHRCEPQAEVLVYRLRGEFFADSLQLRQPRYIQMAILEVDLKIFGRGKNKVGVDRQMVLPKIRAFVCLHRINHVSKV